MPFPLKQSTLRACTTTLLIAAVLFAASAGAQTAAPKKAGADNTPPTAPSATAEAIYRDAKPRLLQIRTLVNTASQKSSTGSGFLISADGLAITNYHVVSQHAMEPQTYRMEYVSADGTRGKLKLLSFDVINDLGAGAARSRRLDFFRVRSARAVGQSAARRAFVQPGQSARYRLRGNGG